jgi:hypothetical protein
MFRKSLAELIEKEKLVLPAKWEAMRPEHLKPVEFIHLTIDLFGEKQHQQPQQSKTVDSTGEVAQSHEKIWRNVKLKE